MEKLDILESLWENITEFKKRFERCEIIPQTLENYLISVARTGNIIFPWEHVKFLFRCKLVLALREFGDEKGIEDEVRFLDRFDNFRGAPLTIQRLTELILEPKHHCTSKEKYLRALDKSVWITSTVEEVPIQGHLEVKEKVSDDEFEKGGGDEEDQLDDDSWITVNDSSYLEEEELKSANVKVNLDQKVKDVGNVLNGKKADIHRLPNMENNKILDHQARSNIYCDQPRFLPVQQSLSNLNARTHCSPPIHKCPFCPLTYLSQFLLKWHINDKHLQEKAPEQNVNDTGSSGNTFFSFSGSSRIMQWKHSGKNIHHSQLCDKTFGTELGLKRPTQSHSNYTKSIEISSNDSNQKALKKKSQDRKFSCSFCPKSFKQSNDFKRHEKIHTGEKPFNCSICKKAFTQQSNLDAHLRIHTGEKPFSCAVCKKAFARRRNLYVHFKTHTGEKPFKYFICKTTFTKQQNLDVHLRTRTGEKRFKCSICKQAFTHLSAMEQHIRSHTGEKPFKCSECGKAFSVRGNLTMHIKIHTKVKPFSCAVCEKAFTRQSSLDAHLRTHTGEKPFSCAVCEKAFAQKSYLYVHFRTHTGEKPFVCSVCGKRFSQSSGLNTHCKIHSKVKP